MAIGYEIGGWRIPASPPYLFLTIVPTDTQTVIDISFLRLPFVLIDFSWVEMASIHFTKGKADKKTYYVVICHRGGHKWVKAGTLRDAKILKREIESLENSKRMDKLGLTGRHKRRISCTR